MRLGPPVAPALAGFCRWRESDSVGRGSALGSVKAIFPGYHPVMPDNVPPMTEQQIRLQFPARGTRPRCAACLL